jgi:hypothetical protein
VETELDPGARRHHLWVAKLREEILYLYASHFDLLSVLVQVCSCL